VQRERGRIPDGPPPSPDRDARRIGEIIPALMAGLGSAEQSRFAALDEDWAQIVGKAVAAHTRPGGIARNELIVFVDSSVWLMELARFGGGAILRKVQELFGDAAIAGVKFRLDPDGPR